MNKTPAFFTKLLDHCSHQKGSAQLMRALGVFLCVFFVASQLYAASEVISIVKSRSLQPYNEAIEGFVTEMKSTHDLKLDVYDLKEDNDDVAFVFSKIRASGAKVIVAVGTEAAIDFAPYSSQIPVVAAMVYNAESHFDTELNEKHMYAVSLKVPLDIKLAKIKRILPDVSRLSIIYRDPIHLEMVREFDVAAQRMGIILVPIFLENLKDIEKGLKQAMKESDALLMVLDQEIYNKTTAKYLLLQSARKKFPLIAFSQNYVKSGVLLSIESDFSDNGHKAAELVKQLLLQRQSESVLFGDKHIVAWNEKTAKAFNVRLTSEGRETVSKTL